MHSDAALLPLRVADDEGVGLAFNQIERKVIRVLGNTALDQSLDASSGRGLESGSCGESSENDDEKTTHSGGMPVGASTSAKPVQCCMAVMRKTEIRPARVARLGKNISDGDFG